MQTITRTAKSITLRQMVPGWKATGMIEIGTPGAGNYEITSFDAVRPENGDKGWKIMQTGVAEKIAHVATLADAKQAIADRINELAKA